MIDHWLARFGCYLVCLLPGVTAHPAFSDELFRESLRPQFHYTTQRGWINDPIGLVFFDGEYHLFNDHNVVSTGFPDGLMTGEQSHWSHAVSRDLVHWQHLPIAVYPDKHGACWSGSGVVDWRNSSGFQSGDTAPLLLFYTSAGDSFSQSMVYSVDRGRSWVKHEGNPVLHELQDGNRDPNVFWHAPTEQWVMVLWVERGRADFFASTDLKEWTPLSQVALDDFYECPDLFELPVDGDEARKKWVIYDASFRYWVGHFDGKAFTAESGPWRGDVGKNFYAAQTWYNTPERRVQIAWMRNGKYPDMPFNQQMSFPCELTLRSTESGPRLYRYPIPEIASLYRDEFQLTNTALAPGDNPLSELSGTLWDIHLEFEPRSAHTVGIRVYDVPIRYANGTLTCLGAEADVPLADDRLELRILVDRTSIELFANRGQVSMSSCFVPPAESTTVELFCDGGQAQVRTLSVRQLASCWATEGASAD